VLSDLRALTSVTGRLAILLFFIPGLFITWVARIDGYQSIKRAFKYAGECSVVYECVVIARNRAARLCIARGRARIVRCRCSLVISDARPQTGVLKFNGYGRFDGWSC
jgi:hypothetical protein